MTTSVVVATTRPAMVAAHQDIATWIQERRRKISAELEESKQALATARARKWGTDALARQVRSIEKHDVFLAKVCGAIEAGYSIVPNFDLAALAVRTDKGAYGMSESRPVIGAARLPAGQGEYVSPEPEMTSWQEEREWPDKSKRKVTIFQTTAHAPVDVPFALMKKDLADALHQAMQERLFDEIGIVRDAPRGDPVLVGRITHPKSARWNYRGVTFFVGWWFDVNVLD